MYRKKPVNVRKTKQRVLEFKGYPFDENSKYYRPHQALCDRLTRAGVAYINEVGEFVPNWIQNSGLTDYVKLFEIKYRCIIDLFAMFKINRKETILSNSIAQGLSFSYEH